MCTIKSNRCTGGFGTGGPGAERARVTCAMVDCWSEQWPEGSTCVATVDDVKQCCKSGLK